MADPTVDELLAQLSSGSIILTALKGSVFELILSEVRSLRTELQTVQQQQKEILMSIQTLSDHIDQLIQTAVSGVRTAVDQAKVATTQSAGTPAGQPDPAIDELDKKVTDALKTLQDTFAQVTTSASSGSSAATGSPPNLDTSGQAGASTPDMGSGTAPTLPGQTG
jgi:DNA anti-recombination protein RmuC